MFFLAALLLGVVLGTNENCIYYYDYPIDCYYQLSGYLGEASYGLECNMDSDSTTGNGTSSYTVTVSYYDSSDCSGSAYSSYDSYCYDTYCNCDGSLDDCSIVTWSVKSCLDSYEYDSSYSYIVNLCYYTLSSYG